MTDRFDGPDCGEGGCQREQGHIGQHHRVVVETITPDDEWATLGNIECRCGDVLVSVEAMHEHIHLSHPNADRAAQSIDADRLAWALLRAVPGYQRWLDWPVTTADERMAREDARDAEVNAHALAIARAYAEVEADDLYDDVPITRVTTPDGSVYKRQHSPQCSLIEEHTGPCMWTGGRYRCP